MEPRKEHRARRIVFRVIAALLLIILAAASVIRLIFPPHGPLATTGEYAVASVHYTYTDESRIETFTDTGAHRKVNVQFWYPSNATGVYPLVIFSHGGLGIKRSNESLYNELASHGYVVGSIGHPYHALWTKDAEGRITLLNLDYSQELQREDATRDKQQSYAYYQQWMHIRMADINLVIDTILRHAAAGDKGVYSLVDAGRLGVMGHSLGGAAALGIGRQRDDVAAVIALEAPFMYDIVGVEDDEFVFINTVYPAPVLNIYSDSSWNQLDEWAQYARNYALLADTQATAFTVHISGVGHLSLTDLALSSPFLARMLDGARPAKDGAESLGIINEVCLEFFDRYLKNQGEFTSYGVH